MEELSELIVQFEERNNLSIDVVFFGDGSSVVREFWEQDNIKELENFKSLFTFLRNGKLLMDENGLCCSPILIVSE